jgi:hypothetical protein
VREEDARKNKHFWSSWSGNKDKKKLTNRAIKMTRNKMHHSIITVNVNGFNAPIKRNIIANWIKK